MKVDDVFFRQFQPQLLGLVNSNEGRDVFMLPRDYPTIVEIQKNFVKYLIAPGEYISDFRVGSKYGNLTRTRWEDVERGLDHMSSSIYQRRLRVGNNKWLPVVAGATDTTFRPDAVTESCSVDGWARAPESTQTWSTIRDASGNASSDDSTSLFCFLGYAIDGVTGWNRNYRSVIIFDTSSIGSDVISAAVLSMVGVSGSITDGHSGSIAACEGDSASSTSIANGDYQLQKGKDLVSPAKALSSLTADGSAYTDFTLSSDGEEYITTDGVTKFSSQIEADRADSEPSVSGSTESISRIDWAAADTSGTSADPKLVVTHAGTFVQSVRMF